MILHDTIVAISSASGRAVRMIVRVSGPEAMGIVGRVCLELQAEPAAARWVSLRFCDLTCPAWIYTFVAPRSYTGQDVVELHIPGNALLARMLVGELIRHGARQAEPGEFSSRAYFNGRMDLSQAEGVAAAIAATSRQHLAAAQRLLGGELSRRLGPIMDAVVQTLALVEAGIDFSDQDVEFLPGEQARRRIVEIAADLEALVAQSVRFEALAHEPRVVLAGRPNAGKSTLLNALAGQKRAVVSEIAGTTRDALSAQVMLERGMIHLIDVAGIDAVTPGGEIEEKMRVHAQREIEGCDVLVLVHDVTDLRELLRLERSPDLTVLTKIDLPAHAGGEASPHPSPPPEYQGREMGPGGEEGPTLRVSAATGENLQELRQRLDALAFGSESTTATLALGARHLAAIAAARAALDRAAISAGGQTWELLAADLRECLDCLGQILGVVSPDEVLGKIFSTFCIGK